MKDLEVKKWLATCDSWCFSHWERIRFGTPIRSPLVTTSYQILLVFHHLPSMWWRISNGIKNGYFRISGCHESLSHRKFAAFNGSWIRHLGPFVPSFLLFWWRCHHAMFWRRDTMSVTYQKLRYVWNFGYPMVEGSLEVKLPTIWRDGKTEVGRVREERSRSEKIREEKGWEARRCRSAKR